MAGAARAVQRAITPPKPDIPQPAPQAAQAQTTAMAAQTEAVNRETARLDAADAEQAATRRAAMGRQRGRALLLNTDLGLPSQLGG
jgi:hypothetical protein